MFKALAPRHVFGALFTSLFVVAVSSVGCTVTTNDCDPNTGVNCACNPNTDPNHCQTTCDPATDPNHCQTTCDPATDPSCQAGSGAVDVYAADLITNGGGADVPIVNIDNTLTTKADILLDDGAGNISSIVNYVTVTTPAGTTGQLQNGSDIAHFTGLAVGTQLTFTVQGYLRGLTGNNADTPNTPIAWSAQSTCTAVATGTDPVRATCTPLTLGSQEGILFASDVLPDGYCAGTGASNFSDFRARSPFSGTAQVSVSENDCLGVIFVPTGTFDEDSSGNSEWGLSLETTGSGPACSLASPCAVQRASSVHIVGSECQLTATSTGDPSCF